MENFENLVSYIFNSICSSDSQPAITFNTNPDNLILITVTAPADKVGQLIGREGKIIKAVRTILNLSYPNVKYQIDFGPKDSTPVSAVTE